MIKKSDLKKSLKKYSDKNEQLRSGNRELKELLEKYFEENKILKEEIAELKGLYEVSQSYLKASEMANSQLTEKLKDEDKVIEELITSNGELRRSCHKVSKENSKLEVGCIELIKKL